MKAADPTICAVIQARMTSSRLPGKVLLPLGGKTILEQVVERVARIRGLHAIAVAIPEGAAHQPIRARIEEMAGDFPVKLLCVAGSEDDVLSRTLAAAQACAADIVIRITSDCPFIDPETSAMLLEKFLAADVVYARFDAEKGYPLGFDTEIIARQALEKAAAGNPDAYEKEHATPYIWRRPAEFPSLIVTGTPDFRHFRLVIDEEKDYEFAQKLWAYLAQKKADFGYSEIVEVLKEHPELLEINRHVRQAAMIGRKDGTA